MPKNKGKGGKNRRRGKNENESEKRDLVFKEEGQEYAQVLKVLGNGYVETLCFDGVTRISHIRGKMRKKVWVNLGDIVLVGLRDFQKDRADVIHKYSADEAKRLKNHNIIPDTIKLAEGVVGPTDMNKLDNDTDVMFDYNAEIEVAPQERSYDVYDDISDDDSDDYEELTDEEFAAA